jgi:general secretion pathway protein A
MYLNFFGLKKEPFHITPDPEFFYLSSSHKEALAGIIYGIKQKKGFVAITGDVGVGKTTVLRTYLESAEKSQLKIVYVFNARLTFEGLIKTIFQELGITVNTDDTMEMVNQLYEFLIAEYKLGNSVVLVVDEAQNMPIETLENLRMLSNLETSKDKLLQIVLVGQSEFEVTLNCNSLRQLKQRIAIRSRILALTQEESLDYIKHRLQKAGSSHSMVFAKGALKKIAVEAAGIPRVINILCDNTLITSFGYQQKPVSAKIVREVIADFRGEKRRPFPKWQVAGGVAVIVIAAGLYAFSPYLKGATNWFSESWRATEGQQEEGASDTKRGQGRSLPQEKHAGDSDIKQGQTLGDPKAKDTSRIGQNVDISSGATHKDTPSNTSDSASAGARVSRSKLSNTARTRVIRKGDTLNELIQEEYGRTDEKLIEAVKQSNPKIVNPDLIMSGSKIVLPSTPSPREATDR